MDCDEFEGKSFYEEKDEKESGVHEEEDFDNRLFVEVEDNVCAKVRSRRNNGEEDNFTMDTASSSKTKEEENLENMERKLKKLEELFSSVPTVLIKRVLCRDDVKGDFNKARQTLQEFQGMGNSQDFIKLPANYRPIARRAPDNFARSENKKGKIEITESQNYQESRRKIGVTRKLKIENQNETQDRNGGEKNNVYLLRKNSFDINEPKLCENQVFPDRDAIQVGLACRCEARILGGGFDQGQGDNQKYSENVAHELGYGVPLNDHMFQSQRGRDNWRGQCSPAKPKGNAHRGVEHEDNFYQRNSFFQDDGQSPFTQTGQGRDQSRRGRGRGGPGHDGTHEHPVYPADKINEICRSFDDLDLGDKEEVGPNRCGQGNLYPGGSGSNLKRGHDKGGMGSAQSPSKGMDKDVQRVLAGQHDKLHVLNKAQLTVRIFNDSSEDDDHAFAVSDLGTSVDNRHSTSFSQRSRPKERRLYMVVDPDVMEYVTTTSLHDQLKVVLATKKIEIDWKMKRSTAVLLYHGEDNSTSRGSECTEEVQTWLDRLKKQDVEVNKAFWEDVKAQLPSICACFGVQSPLVKIIDDSFVVRIVSLASDAEDLKEKLKAKLEEIYQKETRKTYVTKTEKVSLEHLTLLKKIRFVEKLKEKNKELAIKLDTEAEEIYFEGPQPLLLEVTTKFHEQISGMVEKKLSLSKNILKILSLDEGLEKVKCELEKYNVEAVFVIDSEARIIGTSAAHAVKAASLVSKLTLEEKVLKDGNGRQLLKTTEWYQLCEQLNASSAVLVHGNNWNDTYVSGFREDVREAIKTLTTCLDTNCIREEQMKCSSKLVRKYLSELRQDDLSSIEVQLRHEVKIQTGKGDDDFVIWGNKEGIKRAKSMLEALADSTECEILNVKQPGLRNFFASGNGDLLVSSVEKNHACVIHIQKKDEMPTVTEAIAKPGNEDSDDDDDDDDDGYDGAAADDDDIGEVGDKDEENMNNIVTSTDSSTLVTGSGHKISWKPGNIKTQQANILVSSQGACSQAIVSAGGQAMRQNLVIPNTGDITVTRGSEKLACDHVIHVNCSKWHGGTGELVLRGIVQKCLQKADELGGVSIAFPVIGTGNLRFSPATASRIMLEETINFCQTNTSSAVKDIRFVVFHQDKALNTAFAQEMAALQSKHRPSWPQVFQQEKQRQLVCSLPIQVIKGDLTKENTDAIININSRDMNLSHAGDLSKAILKAGGPQIQQECSQYGEQPPGTAVMTSGGNLAARHIIHIIPGSQDKIHLQACLEEGLRLADQNNLQTVSIPSVGTGGFNLSASDSAQVTFKALDSFSKSCKNVRHLRIVVFQAQMVSDFLQERQRAVVHNTNEQQTDSFCKAVKLTRNSETNLSSTGDYSVKLFVTGKDKGSVSKAVESLKKGFSKACTTQKIKNETVRKLTRKQINMLRRKAQQRDVRLEIEDDVDCIVVRGDPLEVLGMVGKIWHTIYWKNKKIQEDEQAIMVSKNVQWSYEIHGKKKLFSPKTNGKLEMAYSKKQSTIRISLQADDFVMNLQAKTGHGMRNGETIKLSRKARGAEEGIFLPISWAPMPSPDMTVHTVTLVPGSSEYQNVVSKFQASTGGMHFPKIERVQNPHLYKQYMIRKQKMDKDNGGNNERQLFHGTYAENIRAINTQGFNRSFCGAHGTSYGRGVYFARVPSFSVKYARGAVIGAHYVYLARVLVGKYCQGNSGMIIPPPKILSRPEILFDSVVDDPGDPAIFVVFYDTQCYPEYLISF